MTLDVFGGMEDMRKKSLIYMDLVAPYLQVPTMSNQARKEERYRALGYNEIILHHW